MMWIEKNRTGSVFNYFFIKYIINLAKMCQI